MIYIFFYKISSLLTGLCIIFLGFRLFIKGVFNESGDIQANWKDSKLMVKKAAPGTYFVLFGSIVVGMAVFKGFSSEEIAYGKDGSSTTIMEKPLKVVPFKEDTLKIK